MTSDYTADCIVIGKQGDTYYLTAAVNGGGMVSLAMNEAVYRAMILRASEMDVAEARERARKTLDDCA